MQNYSLKSFLAAGYMALSPPNVAQETPSGIDKMHQMALWKQAIVRNQGELAQQHAQQFCGIIKAGKVPFDPDEQKTQLWAYFRDGPWTGFYSLEDMMTSAHPDAQEIVKEFEKIIDDLKTGKLNFSDIPDANSAGRFCKPLTISQRLRTFTAI